MSGNFLIIFKLSVRLFDTLGQALSHAEGLSESFRGALKLA
jgi:hypothetical protein